MEMSKNKLITVDGILMNTSIPSELVTTTSYSNTFFKYLKML